MGDILGLVICNFQISVHLLFNNFLFFQNELAFYFGIFFPQFSKVRRKFIYFLCQSAIFVKHRILSSILYRKKYSYNNVNEECKYYILHTIVNIIIGGNCTTQMLIGCNLRTPIKRNIVKRQR